MASFASSSSSYSLAPSPVGDRTPPPGFDGNFLFLFSLFTGIKAEIQREDEDEDTEARTGGTLQIEEEEEEERKEKY